jgi:beta-glucosidase/6-phospho-beta-glucosidase/beta-galactosidase
VRFGVATAGFQIEGGYNAAGAPANNWASWEAAQRVDASGAALDFWNRFEEQLDRVTRINCDTFRMSVEWARCEPSSGQVDDTAFDRYARILDAVHERNLLPVVTLHHFTHPAWLGADFWLTPDAPERYATWVDTALERLAGRCRHWVTINEMNVYALQTYLTGEFPPGRRLSIRRVVRSLDNMLAGHVLAYDAIKTRQPQAVVTTNNYCFSIYELDRLLIDVLLAKSHGITRHELGPWLAGRRTTYHASVAAPSPVERFLRRRARSALPLDKALPRAAGAVYDSAHQRLLDVVAVDHYLPRIADHMRVRGRGLWGDRPNPTELVRYLRLNHEPGLPVWIVENGLCSRDNAPRRDGWTRPRYLREHLAAVRTAIDKGVPVEAYLHWTLADNYEWGSYAPRFGLFAAEPGGGPWSPSDAMGDDAAGAYRDLIAAW